MYSDKDSITFYIINDDHELYPFSTKKKEFIDKNYDIFSCGNHIMSDIYECPLSFYDDMNIDRDIRISYFFIPTLQESEDMLEEITSISKDYIIIHQKSST